MLTLRCKATLDTGVSGWIGQRKDYLKVWSTLEAPDSEVFTLVWESKALLALNSAIGSFMAQQAYQEIAKWTITHVTAWPTLASRSLHGTAQHACLTHVHWLSLFIKTPHVVGETAHTTSVQEACCATPLLAMWTCATAGRKLHEVNIRAQC